MKIKNTFLITGGCGFIGSALIRYLLSDKENIIINVDKISYASNKNSINTEDNKRYTLIEEDINSYNHQINLVNLSTSIYFIKVESNSGVNTFKLRVR